VLGSRSGGRGNIRSTYKVTRVSCANDLSIKIDMASANDMGRYNARVVICALLIVKERLSAASKPGSNSLLTQIKT
jgi:hypothetical protein